MIPPAALAAALLALAPAAGAAQVEKVFTLAQAQAAARLNNAAVLAAEQDIRVAQLRVHEARLQFLPEIGVQASASRYEARYPFALAPEFRSILLFPSIHDTIYSGRAYVMHALYEGGRTVNLLRMAHSALQQARTKHDVAKMDADLEAVKVFYRLALDQERHAAAGERLAAAQAAAAAAPGSAWERVEAEALVAGLRARRDEAGHSVRLSLLEFRKALNLELDTPVRVDARLESRPVEIDLAKAIVWAMELRPELQSETAKAQMDEIAVNLALARRIPTVVAALDYEVTHNKFPLRENNWDASVGVRIPLPFDVYAQVLQKRAQQRQGSIRRAERQDQVRLEVRQAYEETMFWQAEWPRREAEHLAVKGLAEAAGDALRGLDAVRAQASLLDARDRWTASVVEHIRARARLERAVGRPLAP